MLPTIAILFVVILTVPLRLVDICHKKCIGTSYNASDLDKNESLCVDRCVAKYFDTNLKVGDSMQKVGQNGAFGVNR